MKAFYGTRISNHISKTPEGYLVCAGTPVCRTGSQQYRASELGLDSNDVVEVYRDKAEVLHPACIASFEGKPICDEHPGSFVNPSNYMAYGKGHMQNVRAGEQLADGEIPLVADLVITDQALIDKILGTGVRNVSCGYNCEYVDRGDGTFEQTRIRGNHAAIVRVGRAGGNIRILDSASRKLSFEELCSPQLREALAAAERNNQMRHEPDPNLIPVNDSDSSEESFEDMCRRLHRQPVTVHGRVEAQQRKCRERIATDAAEDFEEVVRRVRRKLLSR